MDNRIKLRIKYIEKFKTFVTLWSVFNENEILIALYNISITCVVYYLNKDNKINTTFLRKWWISIIQYMPEFYHFIYIINLKIIFNNFLIDMSIYVLV